MAEELTFDIPVGAGVGTRANAGGTPVTPKDAATVILLRDGTQGVEVFLQHRVKGMPFEWSLNPYTGCAHRCTFCYVRAFEARAERPSEDRYGRSIRVKVNVADVLRGELARSSWHGEHVAVGAATDPYQPAEGRYRLTRGCLEALADAWNPFGIITRGPMIIRDIDVLTEASRRAKGPLRLSVARPHADNVAKKDAGTGPPPKSGSPICIAL